MTLAQQLEEVMKLVSETGDRCVILRENADPLVIMNIVSYRRLLNAAALRENLAVLSESELLDKINQDIAEWRASRRDEFAEYDLAQFRIPEERVREPRPRPVRAGSRPLGAAGRHSPDVENLPIVEGGLESEYELEPAD